ncbi:hypothetical protein C8A03DRAFT_36514 [Achaetomium macrosporum]|uniref:Ubiquitin-like domain-containing protein n=1 Tax=Achaetomium macrosporum TaxID=79813 RepID=A0AAN7C5W8_9PEZI|nr:hypothetical protein C8A03DRAFT_36514 [Achaetomium macrosporum]
MPASETSGSTPLKVVLKATDPTGLAKEIWVDDGRLKIALHRTLRVPEVKDKKAVFRYPPNFGPFPLFSVKQYADTLPPEIASRGGLFLGMHERDALWIKLDHSNESPVHWYLLKIYAGGINVITGKPPSKAPAEDQDYVKVPGQGWVYGFAVAPGKSRQFVARPLGSGATVEGQLTGKELHGGIQIEILKAPGFEIMLNSTYLPPITAVVQSQMMVHELQQFICPWAQVSWFEDIRFHGGGKELESERTLESYGIKKDTRDSCEMGAAAGGKIQQEIQRTGLKWDTNAVKTVLDIQILNSEVVERATGRRPLFKPPISMAQWVENRGRFDHVPTPTSEIHGRFEMVAEGDEEDEEEWQAHSGKWQEFMSFTVDEDEDDLVPTD